VSIIAARLNRIKPSPSVLPDFLATSMQTLEDGCHRLRLACEALR